MQVREAMTETVRVADPDTLLPEIASIMRDEDIGAVPVVENDKLIGMITDRDIVVRAVAENRDLGVATAREVMSPGILYCFEDQRVEEVLENMAGQQVRRLPVVNRDKRLVGVVSLGDLSQAARKGKTGEALKDISQPVHH